MASRIASFVESVQLRLKIENATSNEDDPTPSKPSRLGLFSSHPTVVSAFLSSLWGWPFSSSLALSQSCYISLFVRVFFLPL